ncbi:hypothetical protein [Nocardia arizonensis]|uniref:hypothetical protein n=1 Tax=Nocardia arizonensis TaxID=1141647 RepID=UPI0006D1CEB9|nr:hypothetical protein [Nocardia arizonensis]
MDTDHPGPGRAVLDLTALLGTLDCHDPDWAGSSAGNAHTAMQRHRECLVGECVTKTAAFIRLRDEGRLTPDPSRTP